MALEQKYLLSAEQEDDTDTESQSHGCSSSHHNETLKRSWLPAVLIVYSLVTTAFLVLPHVYHQPKVLLPYCKFSYSCARTSYSN